MCVLLGVILWLFGSLMLNSQSATSPSIPTLPAMEQREKESIDTGNLQELQYAATISEIPGLSIITEGGNNPGRLIINGFHNYRIKIFIDDVAYQSDASGSYNLWYLQNLSIEHYIIKNGLFGFVELYLYTKKSPVKQFYLHYQNSSLFPLSDAASLFSQQQGALGATLIANKSHFLSFDLTGHYLFNHYYSDYYQRDIHQSRGFFSSTLSYLHYFNSYSLKMVALGSFNQTEHAFMVSPVNYNSQALSLSVTPTQEGSLTSSLSFSRTAYQLPIEEYDTIEAALLELTYHLSQEFKPLSSKQAFYLGYTIDSGYIYYNYNNIMTQHSYMASLKPSFSLGYRPSSSGWGSDIIMGYPVVFSNRPQGTLTLHNPVATASIFYQFEKNPIKLIQEAGFQRRDPNALELYFPYLSNPDLKPEYYQFYRSRISTKLSTFGASLSVEYGIIHQSIVTGQLPINRDEPIHRLTTLMGLKWSPTEALSLTTDLTTTHSFKVSDYQQVDDLIAKFTFKSALIYQKKLSYGLFRLESKVATRFYNTTLQQEISFMVEPSIMLEYRHHHGLSYYINGLYSFTPYRDGYKLPITSYGPNPDGRLDIGIKWLLQ